MKIEPRTLKGFRDFLPKEARKRAYVLNALKKVFESYGFEPLETPVLEYEDILLGKYGDEGDKLMYRFEDNGKRRVAMRYDQTVPLARVVAQYANDLPLPFKRYQIQNVYRADNTQKGRYREFIQVDIDTVGTSSPLSDAEMLSLVYDSFSKLGFKIKIIVNDRKNLSNIENKYLNSIDKVGKITEQEIIKEMESKGLSVEKAEKTYFEVKNKPEPDSIKSARKMFEDMGNPINAISYVSVLVRGLDYYTGLIFEVLLENQANTLSLGGGGRYDELIGMFGNQQIPAVGFAFGFDRIIEAMEEQNLFEGVDLGGTKVLVTNNGAEISNQLREKGVNVELYVDEKDLDKQLRYADKKSIPYVLIAGDKLQLKNMKTGETREGTLEELIKEL